MTAWRDTTYPPYLHILRNAHRPCPQVRSNTTTCLERATDFVEKWGRSVSSTQPGHHIASEFFAENAFLRATLSAMLRTQTTGINNDFAQALITPTNNTIAQYFNYFGGANVQDLSMKWDPAKDHALEIAPNVWSLTYIRNFKYKPQGNDFVSTVAVLTFIITCAYDDPKIISLISAPMFPDPPSPLQEIVSLP